MQGFINSVMGTKPKMPVSMEVTYDTTFVTPEMAKGYLERNLNNRPLSKGHVTALANALKNREWKMTAEPIKFTSEGVLIDGQHRLQAIIQADIGALLSIARNVEASAFDAMDRGKSRSAADVLAIRNVKYSTAVASGLRLYSQMKNQNLDGSVNLSSVISSQQIELLMDRNPQVHDWAKFSYSGIQQVLNSAVVIGLGMRFAEKDAELSRLFFTRLRDGEGLKKGDPILTLRDRLMINRANISKLNQRAVTLIVVKCWNAFRSNKKLSRIHVSEDEKIQEII